MNDPPASIPEHWHMCRTARNFRAAVSGLTGGSQAGPWDSSMPIRKVVERKDGTIAEGEW